MFFYLAAQMTFNQKTIIGMNFEKRLIEAYSLPLMCGFHRYKLLKQNLILLVL